MLKSGKKKKKEGPTASVFIQFNNFFPATSWPKFFSKRPELLCSGCVLAVVYFILLEVPFTILLW